MRAVILAGGKGTRLAPYTTVFPKPMMPLGDIPILEVVLRQLCHAGFTDITLAVGHLAELLVAYFADGDKFGVRLTYAREETPLGTAGPLSVIEGLDETFLVMNGDLLTNIDYRDLLAYHRSRGALTTIATHERTVEIDYGVLDVSSSERVTAYTEKPTFTYRVSMGIYIFEPRVISLLEPGARLDFPDLVRLMLDRGEQVESYHFSGYWLDIGRPDDYQRATDEFERLRGDFLKGE
ncbi:MAG: sugar phosphate nucleotidyltransferase [Chloroflexota bacterium]|nr:sugar phosphate nucleotidyltransferase [Chloroflexota bacterium]